MNGRGSKIDIFRTTYLKQRKLFFLGFDCISLKHMGFWKLLVENLLQLSLIFYFAQFSKNLAQNKKKILQTVFVKFRF
jgi:hypothetical protein